MMSMFREKSDPKGSVSMTRVTAFLFAVTCCAALILFSRGGTDFGWPFAVVCVFTLLAVPIQRWFSGRGGRELTRLLLSKLGQKGADE